MNREQSVKGEHATLVPMSGGRLGARLAHHVVRYISVDNFEEVMAWRRNKRTAEALATADKSAEMPRWLAEAVMDIPQSEYNAVVEWASQIVDGTFLEPKEDYTLVPQHPSDIDHQRYKISFYVLEYSVTHEAFVPIRLPKHRKFGYLSYWREGELARLDLGRVKREEPYDTYELLREAVAKVKEAASFRSSHGVTGMTSLGEELYRTVPAKTVLKPEHVCRAATLHHNTSQAIEPGDPRVREYIKKYLLRKPVPKSWLHSDHGEPLCGFHMDKEALPAVVQPEHLKQKLWLRKFPEPMMAVDPGLNTPDVW